MLGGCSDKVRPGEDSGFNPRLMIFTSSVSFGLFSHPQFLLARAAAPPPGKLAEGLSGRACSALLPAALKPLVREACRLEREEQRGSWSCLLARCGVCIQRATQHSFGGVTSGACIFLRS